MHMRYRLVCLLLAFAAPSFAVAQTAGGCVLGKAQADLFANDVRARLFNNGGLFWKGQGNVYNVPAVPDGQPITPNALFAAGIWIGGKVEGETRMAAAAYGNWELYPGPLDAAGNAPTNCASYDRIFHIGRTDVADYEATGTLTDDLRDWPYQWGAPVIDGDGNPDNYNLTGGDRPEVLGHEAYWWVMNDAAGPHNSTVTPPMHMEVAATAFAVASPLKPLNQATFYRYRFTYRGTKPLTDAYFGFWSDPDLGNATDDWVGSDTSLSMGFVYNADNFDETSDGYGSAPPALGVTFLEAPEGGSARHMDVFLYYNGGSTPNGDPRNGTDDWYKYMQGIWQDDKPMVTCGDGYNPTGLACAVAAKPTKFMWPGDPVTGAFWSERNFDGAGHINPPNDRKFLMSTGSFAMQPGETKDVVFAIVYARGADNFDSITELRAAATGVRAVWEGDPALYNVPLPAAPSRAPALLQSSVVARDSTSPSTFRGKR